MQSKGPVWVKHPMNDYTRTAPRAREVFVLEKWGDYLCAEPLRNHIALRNWAKFPGDATVRITLEVVRLLTKKERQP